VEPALEKGLEGGGLHGLIKCRTAQTEAKKQRVKCRRPWRAAGYLAPKERHQFRPGKGHEERKWIRVGQARNWSRPSASGCKLVLNSELLWLLYMHIKEEVSGDLACKQGCRCMAWLSSSLD